MLRKLHEPDRRAVLDYLGHEPSYNVFPIGDVDNLGFDNEFPEVWGDFDSDGGYRGVVLRYYRNHLVYGKGRKEVARVDEIVDDPHPSPPG